MRKTGHAIIMTLVLALAITGAPATVDTAFADTPIMAAATAGKTTGARSLSKAKLTVTKKIRYTGKRVKPAVTVKLNGKKVSARNYRLTYLNSKKKAIKASKVRKPGTYYVRITGKGKFSGTKTAKFRVWSKNGQIWVPGKKKRVWVSKIVREREVLEEAYTDWGYDTHQETVARVLADGTAVALNSEGYSKLYLFPDGETLVPYRDGGYWTGYYIDDKESVTMPEAVLDFFKTTFYEGCFDENATMMWQNLVNWADSDNFDPEATAQTIRFFDTRLGPIELDENGNWKDSERQKYQKYVDALTPIMPQLKKAAQGVSTGSAHGGISTYTTADILTNYRLIHYPAVYGDNYLTVDHGYYKTVITKGHWKKR